MTKCILAVPNPMIKTHTVIAKSRDTMLLGDVFYCFISDVSETFDLDFMVLGDVSTLHLSQA